jgi:hypothetical protein
MDCTKGTNAQTQKTMRKMAGRCHTALAASASRDPAMVFMSRMAFILPMAAGQPSMA